MIVVTGLSVSVFSLVRIGWPQPLTFVSTSTTPVAVTKAAVLPPPPRSTKRLSASFSICERLGRWRRVEPAAGGRALLRTLLRVGHDHGEDASNQHGAQDHTSHRCKAYSRRHDMLLDGGVYTLLLLAQPVAICIRTTRCRTW